MKNENIIDEIIGKIEAAIELVEKAEFVKDVDERLIESGRFFGREGFMFLAGAHIGIVSTIPGIKEPEKAAKVIIAGYEEAAKMFPDTVKIDADTLVSLNRAVGERIEEMKGKCVCDACRAKREEQ